MKPMRKKKDFITGQCIVTKKQMTDIWCNITAIYSINSFFLEKLLPAKEISKKLMEQSGKQKLQVNQPKIVLAAPRTLMRTNSHGSLLRIPTEAYLDEVMAFMAETEGITKEAIVHGEILEEKEKIFSEPIDPYRKSPSPQTPKTIKRKKRKSTSKSLGGERKKKGRGRKKKLKFSASQDIPKISVEEIGKKVNSEFTRENSKSTERVFRAHSPQEIISKAFTESAQFFKNYLPYCNNQDIALETLENLCKNSQFEAFLQERADIVPECRSLTLKDMLIKPIQRICKYPLLLRVSKDLN